MNQPYVKEYLRDDAGNLVLDEKGRKIVTNPLDGDYINIYPNRQMRRYNPKKFNCRKGRNYYQPRMKPVYDSNGAMDSEGERLLILYSIPDGTTIQHKVTKLSRKR